jgi:glycerol uptake facilitator protein
MLHSYFMGEMMGSMFLILFGGGVVAGVLLKYSKAEGSGWIVITAGWGFAVMIGIFVAMAAGSPQADINPVVSLAKYGLGIYTSFGKVMLIVFAQVIGCFLGGILVWLVYYPHWKATKDQRFKLMVFATSPEIRHAPSNFLCEMLATAALIIIVGALIKYGNTYNFSDGALPYIFGFVIWGIGLSLGGPTGYAINPARDLGPRIAHAILPIAGKGSSEWKYAWIPVCGPIVGMLVGLLFIYAFIQI